MPGLEAVDHDGDDEGDETNPFGQRRQAGQQGSQGKPFVLQRQQRGRRRNYGNHEIVEKSLEIAKLERELDAVDRD
jgi:hypothetical protein